MIAELIGKIKYKEKNAIKKVETRGIDLCL